MVVMPILAVMSIMAVMKANEGYSKLASTLWLIEWVSSQGISWDAITSKDFEMVEFAKWVEIA